VVVVFDTGLGKKVEAENEVGIVGGSKKVSEI
jgi:hypothetical protein